jgi:Flp pilus assembly protein TadG
MVSIIAFAGLAIDVGSLRATRRHLQAAADAAALSAALAVPSCAAGTTNCAAVQTAASSSLAENGLTGATIQTNCTSGSGTGLALTVNNPPCMLGTADPNQGNFRYVEVTATQAQTTNFASVLGFSSVPISVRAEAKVTPNPNCVYALDPSRASAITVDALATVTSSCGIVDESSSPAALTCNLIASVTAPSIEVVGGNAGFLCLLPNTVPKDGVPLPTPADPLSGVPKPAVPACGPSPQLLQTTYHGSNSALVLALGTFTLYPDAAYCGGITIAPTANVTFMPGTYTLESNGLLGAQGGMTISTLATVQGNGVTFYNYGPHGGITMLAPGASLGLLGTGVNLTAPKSGTYSCMLFMQDPQNSDLDTIVGQGTWNTNLEGAMYFPSANVLFAASLPAHYNILVAKDIEFLALSFGASSFASDYSSIPNGCPMAGGGSVLVQ